MPRLKTRAISSQETIPRCWIRRNIGRISHLVASSRTANPSGITRGRLSSMPPPVICAMPVTSPASSSRRIVAVRLKQFIAECATKLWYETIKLIFAKRLPGERIAVGMQAERWEANRHVALSNGCAGYQAVAFDDSDNAAGQIVFTWGIEAGHRRRFAADERAARLTAARRYTLHHGNGLIGVHDAERQIIQEEEWTRAADQNVIDAVRYEVRADRAMAIERKGNLELGADAIY